MKRALLFGSIALVLIALVIATAGWIVWRSELKRLKVPQSVTDETGLRLPSDARITATRADLFSLADRDNYAWLIESDSSLLPWVSTNMSIEHGGWEHIRYLAELGDFKNKIPSNVKFGGVWKSVRQDSRGREQTSYLDLADDGRIGILRTFRP